MKTAILIVLAVLAVVAQVLDLSTFAVMVAQHGPGAEANIVVSTLYGTLGLSGVIVGKILLSVLVVGIMAGFAALGSNRPFALTLGTVTVLAGSFGAYTNILTIH